MGVLGGVAERLRRFGDERLERRIAALVAETAAATASFRSEAGRFGIDVGSAPERNHYEVLGIGYTDDQKRIRDAYVRLIKRYHPDVNKEKGAKEAAERINEAYGVLKEKRLKEEYDRAFSRGATRLSADAATAISDALFREYIRIREREFDDFRKRVSVPLTPDAIKAAIEDVLDWKRRFKRAVATVLGSLLESGREVRRLSAANRSLLRSGSAARASAGRLERNVAALGELVEADGWVEKGVAATIDEVRRRIGEDEAKVAQKLRASV